jgi:peptidylprolyl isomerase
MKLKETNMEKVENGLFVSVDYKGTLQNGDVFDTSHGRQPLEVKMGAGQLIAGFEKELMGMSLNEKKSFTIDPEDAYGQRNEGLMRDIARTDVPSEINPEVGMTVGMYTPEGQQIPAQIVHVDNEKISLDLNHPLAGKTLTFDIEVVGISNRQTQTLQGCGCGCDCSSDKPC